MTGENICSCEWCEEIKVGMDAVVYKVIVAKLRVGNGVR